MSDLKLFDNFDQLARSGYLFRIGDNRGETADRYTVLFSDGDALGMNESGIGFSQFVGSVDPNVFQQHIELGKWDDIGPDDLSDGTKNHIVRRINETFQYFLNDLAEGKCPRSREAVEKENEGSYDCADDGIWWLDPNVFQQQIELGNWDDIGPDDLSDGTKNHIVRRINETFQDFLNDLAEGKCPRSREAVEKENEGSYDCAGDGIWWDGENFFVAVEENDDRGPFATPAEAVRASLPDEYSLAGPEYHSTHFPVRGAPDEPTVEPG